MPPLRKKHRDSGRGNYRHGITPRAGSATCAVGRDMRLTLTIGSIAVQLLSRVKNWRDATLHRAYKEVRKREDREEEWLRRWSARVWQITPWWHPRRWLGYKLRRGNPYSSPYDVTKRWSFASEQDAFKLELEKQFDVD